MDNQEYQAVLDKQGIKVTAELLGNVLHSFGEKEAPTEKRPHYRITVSNNGNSETFDFWGSIADYCKTRPYPYQYHELSAEDKKCLKILYPFGYGKTLHDVEAHCKKLDYNLKAAKVEILTDATYDAFNCILSDALSGDDTFSMFCDNFGYDNDSRKAEAIYRECQKSLDKLKVVYSGDLYDLANSLER